MKKLQRYAFMLEKFRRDVKTPKRRYPIAENVRSKALGEYYFVFDERRVRSGADQALIGKFDENGIPVNRTYVDVTDKEYVYFPISIGQMGLAVFHTYLRTKKEEDRQRFLRFAEWFAEEEHYLDKGSAGILWMTNVALPQYRNDGPWQSAFAQGRAISILIRAYQLTGKEKYALISARALPAFTTAVGDGGVTSVTKYGPFYEEYTAKVPTLVLNGMIFALFGVYDRVRAFPEDRLAARIFEEGIRTLEKILPEYDLGYWSRYNLCDAPWYPDIDPATVSYQRLHVDQLEVLYRISGKKTFGDYAEIFRRQDTLRNTIKMYSVKRRALKKLGRL